MSNIADDVIEIHAWWRVSSLCQFCVALLTRTYCACCCLGCSRTAPRSLATAPHTTLSTPFRSQWSVRAAAGESGARAGGGLLVPTLDYGGSSVVRLPPAAEALEVARRAPRRQRRRASDVRRSAAGVVAGAGAGGGGGGGAGGASDASTALALLIARGGAPDTGAGTGGGAGGSGPARSPPPPPTRPRRDGLNVPRDCVAAVTSLSALTGGLGAIVRRGEQAPTVEDVDCNFPPPVAASRKVARNYRFATGAVARARAAAVERAAAACDGELSGLRYRPAEADYDVPQPISLLRPPPFSTGPMRTKDAERYRRAEGMQPIDVAGCVCRVAACGDPRTSRNCVI
jgi:hypothetical protein